MKIVITGGLGFIGLQLSERLLREDHELILIDNLSVQIHGELPSIKIPDGAKLIRMDIRDIAKRPDIINDSDVIYHLAAETGTAQSMYEMSHYARINCQGTTSLLEAVAKCTRKPTRLILASSRSVYGEGAYTISDSPGKLAHVTSRSPSNLDAGIWEPVDGLGRNLTAVPTPESLPFSPGSIYAATKAAQELLISSASVALGLNATIFRFQNVYGEGQSLRNPYTGIISIFFNRARQGLHIPVYEDGLESRDFVHVSDVVNMLVSALKMTLPNNIVLNLGSGIPTSVSQLAAMLLEVSGFAVPIRITGQYRIGDIRHCCADMSRTNSYLGITTKVSLLEGLRAFCNWAVTQPVYLDKSIDAELELKNRGLGS